MKQLCVLILYPHFSTANSNYVWQYEGKLIPHFQHSAFIRSSTKKSSGLVTVVSWLSSFYKTEPAWRGGGWFCNWFSLPAFQLADPDLKPSLLLLDVTETENSNKWRLFRSERSSEARSDWVATMETLQVDALPTLSWSVIGPGGAGGRSSLTVMPADGWWLLVGPDVVKHEAITNRGSRDGDLPDCQHAAERWCGWLCSGWNVSSSGSWRVLPSCSQEQQSADPGAVELAGEVGWSRPVSVGVQNAWV